MAIARRGQFPDEEVKELTMLSQKILSDYCQIDNGATVMDVNKEHDR